MSAGTQRFSIAALIALSAALISAQNHRPMTIDDLLSVVRVAEPDLSADGRQVAFTRTTTSLDTGRRNADIWAVAADGSTGPKSVIATDAAETTPVWSPDGRRLAFLSNRDGPAQLYVADADGGNVKQITALSAGAQGPIVYAPDGHAIAFVSDVYPECPDEACNRRMREAADKDPVKARLLTRLLYRHWNEWRDRVRHHVFVVDLAGGGPRDLTPGDFDSPPFTYEDHTVAFSPDSRDVAFVSNREGNDREAWTTNTDVWTVPAAGGEARRLTPNPAADVQPTYSADGRTIYVRAQRRAGFESDRWYLDVYDRATGRRTGTVFDAPDLSVGDFALSADGRSVCFTAAAAGANNLYVVPTTGGPPTLAVAGGTIGLVQPHGDALVFSRSTMARPTELYRANVDGGGVKALTDFNGTFVRDTEIAAPESHTIASADGTPIQYWLLKPPNFDASRKYPVVFLIHGGPQGAWDDAWSSRWNPALWAAQGWVVAAPNPRGSTGFGQTFVDQISQDWGGKVMTDLTAVFDAVAALPYVDGTRQGIAGASYGGYAVNWLIGQTNRFKAAVTHDGVFNTESMTMATEELWFTDWEFGGPPWSAEARSNFAKWSPHRAGQHITTPTLIITNELDFRVPFDQGLQMFTVLRRNGVPAQVLTFPDEGHWVLKALNSRRWHEVVFAWMQKYLA